MNEEMKTVRLKINAVIDLKDCKAGDVVAMKAVNAQKWVDRGNAEYVSVTPTNPAEPVKE